MGFVVKNLSGNPDAFALVPTNAMDVLTSLML
jgi:hypothetical protein